jgi:hypothetical protein
LTAAHTGENGVRDAPTLGVGARVSLELPVADLLVVHLLGELDVGIITPEVRVDGASVFQMEDVRFTTGLGVELDLR